MGEDMIDIVGKKCCGCGACENICPKGCVVMKSNGEGFLYPEIMEAQCIKCGRCETVCPILSNHSGNDKMETWGCMARDRELLYSSSSGGVFSLLAKTVLDEAGIVCGVAFTEDFYGVRHVVVNNAKGIETLRGSKYLQSKIGFVYREIKKSLMDGKRVLFTGTPCQVAGLKGFLGKDYESLVCADIICHGTPSPLFWEKYLKHIERTVGEKAMSVNFRSKENGWRLYGMNIHLSDGSCYYKTMDEDPFMSIFRKDYCLRESCYQCVTKEKGSCADITIGDFWGVENVVPEMDETRGISLVIVHTEKGSKLFKSVFSSLNGKQVVYEAALAKNRAYHRSVARPSERDMFFRDLQNKSMPQIIKKYARQELSVRLRKRVASSLLGRLRRRILYKDNKSDRA